MSERRGVWIEEERQKRALWVEEQRQRRESTVDRRVLPVEEERKSPENTVAQSPTTNPTPKALFPEPQAPSKDNNEDNERDTNDIKTTQRQITFNMIQTRQTPGKQDKEISTKTQQRTPRRLTRLTS